MNRTGTDYHLHTYYSDGSLSPEGVVRWAGRKGLTEIAITDHDGVDGLAEARNAAARYAISVVDGVELSVRGLDREGKDGFSMHLLGYRIDPENPRLKKALEELRQYRRERNRKLLAALRAMGYEITRNDMEVRPEQDYLGKPNFARGLLKKGYIRTFDEAFAPGRFLMTDEIRSIRKKKLPAEEAIGLILEAGGIPVLAHPMKTKGLSGAPRPGTRPGEPSPAAAEEERFRVLEGLLVRLKALGLKGMECFYPDHTGAETRRLVGMAKKHGFCITRGSDFHGPERDRSDRLPESELFL